MKFAKGFILLNVICIVFCLFTNTYAENQTVRFAIISDRTGGHVEGIHARIVEQVNYLRPDFVLSVGDYIEGYTSDSAKIEAEWDEYFDIVDDLTARYYMLPGNHDIWSDLSERIYRKRVGEPYYSFDKGEIHFVMIDVSRVQYGNELSSEQLGWIADDLQKNMSKPYTIVLQHRPIWYETASKGVPDTLHSLFVQYGVDAVFTGHYHEYFCDEVDGIKYTGIGSSGGERGEDASRTGFQFAWVTVDYEGIHVAPIDLGGVYAWNETTAQQKMVHDPIRHLGLSFDHPILIGKDLRPIDHRATVTLRNLSAHPMEDTIRWELQPGWSVHPEKMSVYVDAGDSASFDFLVESGGAIYPLPSAEARFKFADDREVVAKQQLRIARTAICPYVKSAPDLDGHVDESIWQVSADKFFDNEGAPAETEAVEFYFAHDRKKLYIAAVCHESYMAGLSSNAVEHDGPVYGDDCVGFFFEPNHGSDTVYQIYFNPDGFVFDQVIWRGEDGWMDSDPAWNGEYNVGTHKGEKFWSIEIAIPVDKLDAEFEKNNDWRINFRRKQQRLDQAADWQVPIDYDPNTFGILEIK